MMIHHRPQMILCLLAVAAAAAPEARGQDFPDTFVNGEIHTVHSEVLKQDRILFVYLPRGYEEEDGSYPVHYVTDAPGTSNLFHGLLTTLGSYGEMPPGIVVGLSSDGRDRHLHAEKGAAAYLEFVAREVIPFVATAGCFIEAYTPTRVAVRLDNREAVQNHLGGLHAAALALLAETASGLVVAINVPAASSPLLRTMDVSFERFARESVQAEATLTNREAERIQSRPIGKIDVDVALTVPGEDESLVSSTLQWAWVPSDRLSRST